MSGIVIDDAAVAWLTSGAVSLAAMAALEPIAYRLKLLDHPGGRKDHLLSTPVVGGIGIFLGIAVSLVFLHGSSGIIPFLMGAGLLVGVGVLDDHLDLRWWFRIAAQMVAVLVMIYAGGPRIEVVPGFFSNQPVVLGSLAAPFTVFITVGLINAVNMADGVDGLAGTLVMIAFAAMSLLALRAGNTLLASRMLVMVSAIAVFLSFNLRLPWRPRARIFLGNAGSMLLGYTLAWFAYRLTQDPMHPVSPVLPPWLLALPVIDCLALIVRRALARQSPMHADRNHMHHLLLDAGFKPGQVTVVMAGLALLLAGVGILLQDAGAPTLPLVWAFVALTLGYMAFSMRRQRAVDLLARARCKILRLPVEQRP